MALDTETPSPTAAGQASTSGASGSGSTASQSAGANTSSYFASALKSAAAPPSSPPPPPPVAPKASAAKPPQAPVTVYDHFIANDEDVVGQIAFAMYENERRDWLTNWRSQTGSDPTHEHYSAFISSNLTQGQRLRYRSAARTQLDNYYVNHFEGPSPNGDYRHSARADKAAKLAERRRMRRGIAAGVLGVVIIVALAVAAYWALRYDAFGLFTTSVIR